ncbi:hypothetical protein SSX86_006435 [Deinandra increscens subsp. villosa]|uniref:SART-1 family protein DOT2 n=1 Tax=Deinandra increscens subsp. villosa TaxID=3103831 RepID=A0AAP0DEU1_9ASTR
METTRRGRSIEARDHNEPSTGGERWKGDIEDDTSRESKHRSRRREEKDYRTRDREKSTTSEVSKEREKDSKSSVKDGSRDRRKEDEYDREKDRYRDKDREKYRERIRDKEKERGRKRHDEALHDSGKDVLKSDSEDASKHGRDRDDGKIGKSEANVEGDRASELQDRIMRMKEERLKKKSEDASDVLSWVSKSRKLEEKRNAEKEKALYLSKVFEEQDYVTQGEDEDEPPAPQHSSRDLAGFKVLDGLDKVIEGGAVVLTLKDQNILADGDINQGVDMLENVEIGEQKRRNEAYKAAKKTIGVYDDKFNEDLEFEKKMLPQYDDPVVNEGVTLDERGRFGGEAEKKLEELRRRIEGASVTTRFEDLTSSAKISTDYYTTEEMLKFKKPKKKKSLRKKDKLDIEALQAEALSSGLGEGDRGSRVDGKRRAQVEEQERSETEKRNNAFQSAYKKADEASKALRMEQTVTVEKDDEDSFVFGDDDADLHKSLQRARKFALEKQDAGGSKSEPQAIALLASSSTKNTDADNGDPQENKVVFTEMEEFVWGLQLDEEAHNPDAEDVFMEEDVASPPSEQERKGNDGGWSEVKDIIEDEKVSDGEEDVKPDETIHESTLGKGLSGALKLLKDRGTLKDTVEWGGRNMDKKKSKLVGIVNENDDKKEIRIERTDEYGRILTPKEAFRLISHKFHGKGPGKMKQEKRMRQYHEELKVKQMRNADTPSLSVERMREAQSKMKTPYLVLSGHVKPGQTSDPRSGFATMEDFPGSLTPMLGDRKVEHFLGIKRKSEPGDMGPPKKPKC